MPGCAQLSDQRMRLCFLFAVLRHTWRDSRTCTTNLPPGRCRRCLKSLLCRALGCPTGEARGLHGRRLRRRFARPRRIPPVSSGGKHERSETLLGTHIFIVLVFCGNRLCAKRPGSPWRRGRSRPAVGICRGQYAHHHPGFLQRRTGSFFRG